MKFQHLDTEHQLAEAPLPWGMESPSVFERFIESELRRLNVSTEGPVNVEMAAQRSSCRIIPAFGIQSLGVLAGVARVRCGSSGPKFHIYVDSNISTGCISQYREVIAEEVCHVLLDPSEVARVKTLPDFIELHLSRKWRLLEERASLAVPMLLMPSKTFSAAVCRTYKTVIQEFAYDQYDTVLAMMENRLAQYFVVTPELCQRRLETAPGDIKQRIRKSMTDCSETLLELYPTKQKSKRGSGMQAVFHDKSFPLFKESDYDIN